MYRKKGCTQCTLFICSHFCGVWEVIGRQPTPLPLFYFLRGWFQLNCIYAILKFKTWEVLLVLSYLFISMLFHMCRRLEMCSTLLFPFWLWCCCCFSTPSFICTGGIYSLISLFPYLWQLFKWIHNVCYLTLQRNERGNGTAEAHLKKCAKEKALVVGNFPINHDTWFFFYCFLWERERVRGDVLYCYKFKSNWYFLLHYLHFWILNSLNVEKQDL